jgi:hypothetical protein
MKNAENDVSLAPVPVGTQWRRDKMHFCQPDFRRHSADIPIKDNITKAVELCTDLEIM